MKRQKRSFLFDSFDSAEGGFDLFQNSIRSGMNYDSNINDQFEAKVLTKPVKLVGSTAPVGTFRPEGQDEGKSEVFVFMARIEGNNSPHRFLPDPCSVEYTETKNGRRKAFNLIQQHIKVFMFANTWEPFPVQGDKVLISLERNQFGSFKTDIAKQYIKHISSAATGTASQKICKDLKADFKLSEPKAASSYSDGERTWNGKYPALDSPEVEKVYQLWLSQVSREAVEKLEKCGGIGDYELVDCKTDKIGNKDVRLHPEFWAEAKAAYELMKVHAADVPDEDLSVGSTKRSPRQQIRLRLGNANSNMTEQQILTAHSSKFTPKTAPLPKRSGPGGSNHLYGLAIDFNGVLQMGTTEKAQMPNSKAKQSSTYKFWRNGPNDKERFKMMSQEASDNLEPWHFSWNGK